MNEITDPTARARRITRTSYIGIGANVLLAGFKAAVGLLSNSVAIMLDAVNNLTDAAPNLAAYATVFVGFPIWWYREPSIIDTFVESNAEALTGKIIVPFATSGGSGMGDSTKNLQALVPKAKVVEGKRFLASVSAEDLKKWASEF